MPRDPALDAVFTPVRPPTTFEETVERLGTAIRVGLLVLGSRLPAERELARGVGDLALDPSGGADDPGPERPPASHERPQRRHVRRRQAAVHRGGRATDVLSAAAWAILDNRVAVEAGGGARWRASAPSADDLARLHELVERMANADDFEDYRRADIRFHIGLAEAAPPCQISSPKMTEVQGRMRGADRADPASRAGPDPLQRPAPEPREAAARAGGAERGRADPRAHRRDRAHPRRVAAGATRLTPAGADGTGRRLPKRLLALR